MTPEQLKLLDRIITRAICCDGIGDIDGMTLYKAAVEDSDRLRWRKQSNYELVESAPRESAMGPWRPVSELRGPERELLGWAPGERVQPTYYYGYGTLTLGPVSIVATHFCELPERPEWDKP
jgi:hypothetical protein